MDFRNRSARVSAQENRDIFRLNLKRTEVTGGAENRGDFAKVPARQVDLMNAVEDASPAGLDSRRIVAAVIRVSTPVRQVGPGVDAREQNPPQPPFIEQLL